MKKTSFIFFACLVILLGFSQKVFAYEAKSGENILISKEETSDGTLYAAGSTINIEGNIKGDLICVAETVTVNGKIDGDVICAASTININGQISGSARVAGQNVNINGSIGHNLQVLGANVNQAEKAVIGWDFLAIAEKADINGTIGGSLHGALGSIRIAGEIGRDAKLRLGNIKRNESSLTVTDKAKIKGNLFYTAGIAGNVSPEAQIQGQVSYSLDDENKNKDPFFSSAFGFLISVFSAFIVGLVLISLWNKQILLITDSMLSQSGLALSAGTITLIITPIAAIILMFTLIGIPLALIALCLWIIAIYAAKIICGILLGRFLLKKASKSETEKSSLIGAMLAGVIILWLISSLPLVGWIASLSATVWGLGGIYLLARNKIPAEA